MALPALRWDTDTAISSLVLGALLFLLVTRRGFRGI